MTLVVWKPDAPMHHRFYIDYDDRLGPIFGSRRWAARLTPDIAAAVVRQLHALGHRDVETRAADLLIDDLTHEASDKRAALRYPDA